MFSEIYAAIKAAEPVYIWGAGSMAQVVYARLREHDIAVAGFFVDCDTPFAERHELDVPCYRLAELVERGEELSVVVGHGHNELAGRIRELPVVKNIFIIPNPYTQYIPTAATVHAALNGGIASVRSLLADEESYRNLELYYQIHAGGDYAAMLGEMQIAPLFSPERIELGTDETYFDVGAFTGDTVAEFIARVGTYREIVAFEPDRQAASAFREHFSGSAIHLEELGVSDHSGTCGLTRAGSQSAGLAAGDGIELTTIDEYAHRTGRTPTILKVAIPEYTLAALRGASVVLASHPRVVLAVSVGYGGCDDLLDTIRFLAALPVGYRLRLRYRLRMPTQLWLYAD